MDSQKKKKKKNQHKIRNQTYPPYLWSGRQQRKQRKPNPNTLIQSIQSKSKTNQNQYYVYQKKKKKKTPIQSRCTKMTKPNQKNPKSPILARHRRICSSSSSSQVVARPSHCRSQIIVVARPLPQLARGSPLWWLVLADRSRRPLPKLISLKVFLISLSFSLSLSLFISLKLNVSLSTLFSLYSTKLTQ